MGSPLPLPSVAASLWLAAAAAQHSPLAAAPRDEARPFCRFVERADGGQLEVAIATYRKGDVTVTLHAALHVADAEHYAALQRRFEAFDALLYELIAEPGLRPHPGMELANDDWVSMLQSGMGKGLRLADQGDSIDYRRSNFVHADMTPEEWQAALEHAGKSLFGELMSTGNNDPDRDKEARQPRLDVVAAFRSGRGAHAVRILGARLMAEPDKQDREPTVVIEGRNERCLEVLQQQLAAGHKKLGIYYGAAHMAHLERRLLRDLGFERVGEEWIVAWDCSASRFPATEKGLQQKRYRARRDLEELTLALEQWRRQHRGVPPTWDALRAAQPDGKLPGRADGRDPWGRDYVLRKRGAGYEVRCLGSDGVADTDDDVTPDGSRGN